MISNIDILREAKFLKWSCEGSLSYKKFNFGFLEKLKMYQNLVVLKFTCEGRRPRHPHLLDLHAESL